MSRSPLSAARRSRRALALVATAVAMPPAGALAAALPAELPGAPPAAEAAPTAPLGLAAREGNYVALGDSSAAGPLIPLPSGPFGCFRSSHNYPHLAAPRIGLPLRDMTCSGATTANMTRPQRIPIADSHPPQLGALGPGTRVVSLTIGGNDIGYAEILRNCTTPNPFASPCRNRYLAGGRDRLSRRIKATAPKLDAVLDSIGARSPRARTFVVNYAAILPESGGGCWPRMPITSSDVPYLRAKQAQLNRMLAKQAQLNGARLVDWYAASVGHDACTGRETRWVEPVFPGNVAASVHPNRRGMEGAADALVAAVRRG